MAADACQAAEFSRFPPGIRIRAVPANLSVDRLRRGAAGPIACIAMPMRGRVDLRQGERRVSDGATQTVSRQDGLAGLSGPDASHRIAAAGEVTTCRLNDDANEIRKRRTT